MSTLPITLQMGALPAAVKWTPQQLADAIAARMSLQTAQTFALFVTGSTAPTSDVGPWLKNGTTWYVWDSGLGSYVPMEIEAASLGYYIGSSSPDPTVYSFWIQTTVPGSPLALKIYYSGSWVDVYATTLSSYLTIAAYNASIANYSTTAQMNTAISNAVAAITVGNGIFRAVPTADQDIVHAGAGALTTDVSFGTEVFDPDGAFAANIFTAPANGYYHFVAVLQLSVPVIGAATDVDYRGVIVSSGGTSLNMSTRDDTGTGQAFSTGSGVIYMTAGQTAKVQAESNPDAACTVRVNSGGSFFSGFRIR